jgi:hypothetical protein
MQIMCGETKAPVMVLLAIKGSLMMFGRLRTGDVDARIEVAEQILMFSIFAFLVDWWVEHGSLNTEGMIIILH